MLLSSQPDGIICARVSQRNDIDANAPGESHVGAMESRLRTLSGGQGRGGG